ncbi:hypothetical protein BGZ72_001281 [Mortierella alpina]|nr:hypothetical protein BGZ72_001281 [Mortierella alpina]
MASPSTPSTAAAAAGSSNDGETVTHIQMAGLTVLMIRKKDQVIYKLPDNMSVQSLSQDQRERLLAEINLLHHQQTTAQALAATQAQTQQVQMAQAQALAASQGVRPIAPSGHVNGNSSQAGSRASSTPSTPNGGNIPDSQQKTTRRYNKTGKYSKKKLIQQQMLDRQMDGQGGRPTSGEPYPRTQDRLKLQQQQPLVFNSSSPQAYQPIAAATPSPDPASTVIQSSFLQQQLQNQQVSGVASVDHKRQLKLLQEIHELQKQIEAQQATTDTFREHEQTIKRMLAHNKPVDAKTQQSARHSLTEAEKTLKKLKDQLKEKESIFREQYPVASQQLLLLQQQQLHAAAASRLGSGASQSTGGGSLNNRSAAGVSGATVSAIQRAVTDPLQQKIAEHHLAVRNAMTSELEETHKALRRPDWWTPFKSFQDVMDRLIPFHVFQYPAEDLEIHATAFSKRSEAEMNARALAIHRRKHELFQRYNDTIKKSAAKATNPSSALEIYALRHSLEDEQTEYRKVAGEHELVANETKVLREELERRQVQLLQQRRTEAALIEAQQKLMLERQRQEELEKQQDEERQRQMQELQLQQRLEEMQEMQQHLQQQQQDFQSLQQHQQDLQSLQQHHQLQQQEQPAQGSILTAEEVEARRKGDERKELERTHQLELEKQLRIKQDHQQEEEEAARAAAQAASQALAASNASGSAASGRS